MNKPAKITCLLLAFLLCSGLFLTACTGDTDGSATSQGTLSQEGASSQDPYKDESGSYVASLSGKTYGGTVIKILTCGVNETYNSEIISNKNNPLVSTNEPIPDVIDKAQGDRISQLEGLLDIKIEEEYVHDPGRKNSVMTQRIRNDNLSFSADYHIVAPCLYDGATLAQEGQLIDLYSLPGIQMDAPWWDQVFNKELTINGQLYFTIGDIGTINKSSTAALTFNKSLYLNYGLQNKYNGTPYDFVREGKWTLDLVLQLVKEISNDLDGDRTITYKDEYGWGGQLDDMWSLYYGSGSKLANTNTSDGYPELSVFSSRSNTVMEKMQSLVQDKAHYVSANDYFGDAPWPTVLLRNNFIDGHSLFYNGSLSTPIELGEMEDTFGMVPIPKGDEEQDSYYSLVNPWVSNCFAVPFSLSESDYQMVSDVLNAIGALSANLVAPAYLKQCIEWMKSRDDDTIDMIENYILPGRGCDIGMVFAWGGIDSLLHNMASNEIGTFASTYQAIEGSAQAALDETIRSFQNLKQ